MSERSLTDDVLRVRAGEGANLRVTVHSEELAASSDGGQLIVIALLAVALVEHELDESFLCLVLRLGVRQVDDIAESDAPRVHAANPLEVGTLRQSGAQSVGNATAHAGRDVTPVQAHPPGDHVGGLVEATDGHFDDLAVRAGQASVQARLNDGHGDNTGDRAEPDLLAEPADHAERPLGAVDDLGVRGERLDTIDALIGGLVEGVLVEGGHGGEEQLALGGALPPHSTFCGEGLSRRRVDGSGSHVARLAASGVHACHDALLSGFWAKVGDAREKVETSMCSIQLK